MKIGHLSRYRDIARLLIRYGRSDLVRQAGLEDVPEEKDQSQDTPLALLSERFAKDLEALGPTYVKIGQLLSTRADLLPQPFLDALALLQDNVAPFPYEQIEQIVTTELGVRISIDGAFLADELFRAYLQQILVDGTGPALEVNVPSRRTA